MSTKELWPGTEIKVIGCSGEFSSGKTLFGLSIAPKEVKLYDFELSAATFRGLFRDEDRVNVPEVMLKSHPKGYKPIDVFNWWRDDVLKTKPGQFRVIMADSISDIEQGMCDWVDTHPEYFGRTRNQYDKSSGLFWGDVKAYWKMILSDLSSRCETFYFTAHMRQVFKGGTPTGKREAKGKETLEELCSLYLHLERQPDEKGKVPEKPVGVVMKTRIAHTRVNDKGEVEIVSVLPPRLPEATPAAIRAYISKPADYSKLKKGELIEPKVMSEEDRLVLLNETAQANARTEELRSSHLDLMALAAKRQAELNESKARQTATPDQSAASAAKKEEKAKDAAAEAVVVATAGSSTATVVEQKKDESTVPTDPKILKAETVISQMDQLGITPDQRAKIWAKRGGKCAGDLTIDQLEEIRLKFWDMLTRDDLEKENLTVPK